MSGERHVRLVTERYMIMFKLREESYGGSAEEAAFLLSDQILPSLHMLKQMEEEHKVMGGFMDGQRAATFIFDVENFEELDGILAKLPMANVYDVDIAYLQSTESALSRDRKIVSELRMDVGLPPR